MYAGLGVSIAYKPAILRFPSGAVIRTGHLKDDQAYTKYQGHEYPRMLIEELTQIPDEKRYLQLTSSCRSTITELRPQVFCTTNPGGQGHGWVKNRFIDVGPPDVPYTDDEGNTRIFVPATLDDNPVLQEKDPQYIKRLDALKNSDEELWRAWRLGDWDVFAGQVFREFRREKHVVRPFIPKKSFTHLLHMDWGYSENSAFAAHLTAVIPMVDGNGDKFNKAITYHEWHGNLKTPEEWAEIIYKDCQRIGIKPNEGYSDPAMHNTQTDGSVSIAEIMENKWKQLNFGKYWVTLDKGNNNRIQGVATVHNWLSDGPAGRPYWQITENCLSLIKTLPLLTYDERKVEDVDTSLDDHCLHFNTGFITDNGVKLIGEMVGTSGKVLTVGGRWVAYHNVRKTRKKQKLIKLTFSDGSTLVCTKDHEVLTMSGQMVEAQHTLGKSCYRLQLYRQLAKSLWDSVTTYAGNISQANQNKREGVQDCIELFGNITTDLLKRVGTYIIKTTIEVIITLITWLVSQCLNIYQSTQSKKITANGLRRCMRVLGNGMGLQRVESGTRNIMRSLSTSSKLKETLHAMSVGSFLGQYSQKVDFVNQLVHQSGEENQVLMILQKHVQFVKNISRRISTLALPLVRGYVVQPLEVIKIDNHSTDDVYCLIADETHVFAIANGVIVSNCYDSVRYGLSQIRWNNVSPGTIRAKGVRPKLPRLANMNEEGQVAIDPNAFASAKPNSAVIIRR